MLVAIAALAFLLIAIASSVFRPPARLLRWLSEHSEDTLFIVPTARRAIALTIDDAPHPDVTPAILDVLRRYDVKATFFIIGRNAERYPELLAAIRTAGHELANHTYEDELTIRLSPEAFARSAARTDALLQTDGVKWCRPGGGALSPRLAARMRGQGYTPCLATAYPLDLRLGSRAACLQFLANIRPGAILVLHDGAPERRRTVAVLRAVVPRALARGYTFATLSDLATSWEA